MAKTPLLLAFGMHGIHGSAGDKSIPCNKRFFRRAVVPFLKEHVIRGRRKAVVIKENGPAPLPKGTITKQNVTELLKAIDERSFDEKKLRALLTSDYALANEEYARTFNIGLANRVFLRHGFEDVALRINRASPNQIIFTTEPQTPYVHYLSWKKEALLYLLAHFANESVLLLATEILKVELELSYSRDSLLDQLVVKLAKEDPSRAIIITRGQGHIAMQRFFDKERFDITVKEDDYTLGFNIEAAIKYYAGQLSNQELERLARLNIITIAYVGSVADSRFGRLFRALAILANAEARYFDALLKKAKEQVLKDEQTVQLANAA